MSFLEVTSFLSFTEPCAQAFNIKQNKEMLITNLFIEKCFNTKQN